MELSLRSSLKICMQHWTQHSDWHGAGCADAQAIPPAGAQGAAGQRSDPIGVDGRSSKALEASGGPQVAGKLAEGPKGACQNLRLSYIWFQILQIPAMDIAPDLALGCIAVQQGLRPVTVVQLLIAAVPSSRHHPVLCTQALRNLS